MYRKLAGLAAGAIMATASISAASASPSAATMREGGFALAPFSFVKFCLDYPSDCPRSAGPGRVHLTSERMTELASVNRAVNAAIRPTPDTSAFRYWKLNVIAGDCNSFAVQKRHELIQRGWPAAALALTVVKTSWGEGHLVVTVRTDKGDLVLDNLRATIVSWQRTGYDWIMRQSERNPQFWVDLDGGQAGPVYAAADIDDATEVAETNDTSPVAEASDAAAARGPIDGERIVALGGAGPKRAGGARLAQVERAKASAPTSPLRPAGAPAAAAAEIVVMRAEAPRSPDVASLEAEAALDKAGRLATTEVAIGFAPAAAPRSPDVASLEADAATAARGEAGMQAAQEPFARLTRWIADTREAAAPALVSFVVALDRWIEASPTSPAKPAQDVETEAAAAGPAEPMLRGTI
jgi:predicted transglutaminase-like cysteine proteinase